MALTLPQQRRCRENFIEELRAFLADAPCKFTKAQLEAAADAADDWLTANAASFNAALPPAFRTTATQTEKALLLSVVALRRYGR